MALGAALVLLLQVVDFARRFRGARVDPAVVTGQIRYWLRTGILGVMLGLAVTVLAMGVLPPLRPAAYLVLATAGALMAVLGLARMLVRTD